MEALTYLIGNKFKHVYHIYVVKVNFTISGAAAPKPLL